MLKYPSIQSKRRQDSSALVLREDIANDEFRKSRASTIKEFFGFQISSEDALDLGFSYLLSVAISWDLSIVNMIIFQEHAGSFGASIFYPAYFFITLAFAMPIKMLLLFFGRYTKRGYFYFWEMCPIFKGVLWTSAVFSIMLEMINIAFAGLALTYVYDVLQPEIPWTKCKFLGATSKCVPMYSKQRFLQDCCIWNGDNCIINKNLSVSISTEHYFRSNKLRGGVDSKSLLMMGKVNSSWVYGVAVTWVLIFIGMNFGLMKFHYIISRITSSIATITFLPILIVTFFVGSTLSNPKTIRSNYEDMADPHFWFVILVNAVIRITPANFIYLGSQMPVTIKPTTTVILMFGAKLILHILVESWQRAGFHYIARHYNIKHFSCIPFSKYGILFITIPDVLSRFVVPQVWLVMWFLGIWFFGFSTAVYTVTAFFQSLMEVNRTVKQGKLYFSIVFCSVCFLLNIMFTTTKHIELIRRIITIVVPFVAYLLYFILALALFLYTLNRVSHDYYFTYGFPMNFYWRKSLKYSPFFILWIYTYHNIFHVQYSRTFDDSEFGLLLLCYCLNMFMCIPILISIVVVYLRFKNQNKASLTITPTQYWGPPTKEQKAVRQKFRPKQEFRYFSVMQRCDHSCLLNSLDLNSHNNYNV